MGPASEEVWRGRDMEFAKLHGLGNDFLVVKGEEVSGNLNDFAVSVCHRHCGVGADGVLCYRIEAGSSAPSSDVQVTTRIFNRDGGEAEMSGNGIRCLAAFLFYTGQFEDTVCVQTPAGIRKLTLTGTSGSVYTIEGSMGRPLVDSSDIRVSLEDRPGPVVEYPLKLENQVIPVTISSMGNPHCSTFWLDLDEVCIEKLGPQLEQHAIFPDRTNVEFIRVIDRHRLEVRFWERGVGRTLASGTGSCAAVTAATLRELVDPPVTVVTDLGRLEIRRDTDGELFLTGPAEIICTGDYVAGVEAAGEGI